MIQKYVFGTPFETEAVVKDIPAVNGEPAYGCISTENGFRYTYRMDCEDKIYGLGEANRGINKRGFRYISDCTDNPESVLFQAGRRHRRQLFFSHRPGCPHRLSLSHVLSNRPP